MAISALFSTNESAIFNSIFLTEDDTIILIPTSVRNHSPTVSFWEFNPDFLALTSNNIMCNPLYKNASPFEDAVTI